MYLNKAASIAIVLILVSSITLAQDGPQGDPLSFFLDTFESFASVGQFFAGPLSGNQQAVTSLQVTNRDPNQAECEIGILTHHGVFIPSDFPVLINDMAGPFASAIIPRGGVMRFDLTSSQFVQGAIALGFRTLAPAECSASSFRVTATSIVAENLDFEASLGMSQLRSRYSTDQRRRPRAPDVDVSETVNGHEEASLFGQSAAE